MVASKLVTSCWSSPVSEEPTICFTFPAWMSMQGRNTMAACLCVCVWPTVAERVSSACVCWGVCCCSAALRSRRNRGRRMTTARFAWRRPVFVWVAWQRREGGGVSACAFGGRRPCGCELVVPCGFGRQTRIARIAQSVGVPLCVLIPFHPHPRDNLRIPHVHTGRREQKAPRTEPDNNQHIGLDWAPRCPDRFVRFALPLWSLLPSLFPPHMASPAKKPPPGQQQEQDILSKILAFTSGGSAAPQQQPPPARAASSSSSAAAAAAPKQQSEQQQQEEDDDLAPLKAKLKRKLEAFVEDGVCIGGMNGLKLQAVAGPKVPCACVRVHMCTGDTRAGGDALFPRHKHPPTHLHPQHDQAARAEGKSSPGGLRPRPQEEPAPTYTTDTSSSGSSRPSLASSLALGAGAGAGAAAVGMMEDGPPTVAEGKADGGGTLL